MLRPTAQLLHVVVSAGLDAICKRTAKSRTKLFERVDCGHDLIEGAVIECFKPLRDLLARFDLPRQQTYYKV
jgi:hypothetical protein